MWRQYRDVQYSPQGIFKALQHNATVEDISPALFSCLLCGACDVLCPENIDISESIKSLRKDAFSNGYLPELKKTIENNVSEKPQNNKTTAQGITVLAGKALRNTPDTLNNVLRLLAHNGGALLATDDGDDIALALEAGITIPEKRLTDFFKSLQDANQIIVNNAHLACAMQEWLPSKKLSTIGYSLSQNSKLTKRLQSTDFYVIESRAYHVDHKQRVSHYDALRHTQQCQMNLDLQRNAIPTTASYMSEIHPRIDSAKQVQWLLAGRTMKRIVCECAEDALSISKESELPVLHIADLMEV